MPGEQRSQTASPRTPGGRTTPVLVPQGALVGQPDVPLDRPVTTVGSNEQARLHLVSRTVSKGHALFVNSGGSTYVADMASRTGVLVNGKLVRDAELKTGDRVQIGKFVFRYRSPANTSPPPPQPLPPAAAVIVVGSPAIPVERRAVIIGRRETSDIPLPDDTAVSAAHSVIFQMDGKWFIRDLASRTGTQVDGKAIHQQELKFGDRIGIGSSTILFQPAARAAEATADLEDSAIVQIPSEAPEDLEEDIQRLAPVPVDADSTNEPPPLVDWKSAFPVEPAVTAAEEDSTEPPAPPAAEPIPEELDDFDIPLEEPVAVQAQPAKPQAPSTPGVEPEPVPAEVDDFANPLQELPGDAANRAAAQSVETQLPAEPEPIPTAQDEAFADFALQEERAATAPTEPAVAQTAELPLEIEPAPVPSRRSAGVEEEFDSFALADEQPAQPVEQPPVTVRAEPPIDVVLPSVPVPVEAPVESTHEAEEPAGSEETQESAVAAAAELEAAVSEAAQLITDAATITSEPVSLAPQPVADNAAVAPPPQAETPWQEPAVAAPAGRESLARTPAAVAAPASPPAAPPPPPVVPVPESLLADVEDFVFVPASEAADPNAVPEVIFWGDSELDADAEPTVKPPAPASPPVDESRKNADDEPLDDDGPPPPPAPPSIPPGSNGSAASPRPEPAARPVMKPAPVHAQLEQPIEGPIEFGSGEAAASATAQPLGITVVESAAAAGLTEVAAQADLGADSTSDFTVAAEDEYSIPISQGLDAAFQVAGSLLDAPPVPAEPLALEKATSATIEQVEAIADEAQYHGQAIAATSNIADEPQVHLFEFDLTEELEAPASQHPQSSSADSHVLSDLSAAGETPTASELIELEDFADVAPADEQDALVPDEPGEPAGLLDLVGGQVDCSVTEEAPAAASLGADDFNFDELPEFPLEGESADGPEIVFPAESGEANITESPLLTDIAGIANTNPAHGDGEIESLTSSASFAPAAEGATEAALTNEADLEFLDSAEQPVEPSFTDASAPLEQLREALLEKPQAPAAGVSTPQEQSPQLGADASGPAAAFEEPAGAEPAPGPVKPAAPRRGPTLFGFEFEGGSFLGGMPISLAGKAPVVAPPPAPASPATPAPARAFDSRVTPPSGLGAMLQSAAVSPPPQAAPPPSKQRPKTPRQTKRSAPNRPAPLPGLISDARESYGTPVIPPAGKRLAGKRPAGGGRTALTGATKGSGVGLPNTDVFSQMTSPIGVEVFGARPGNPKQLVVPDVEKPTAPGAAQEDSATQETAAHALAAETVPGEQAGQGASQPFEYATATKPASRLRWSRLTVFASLMLLIPALAWTTLHFAVSESTTYAGYLNFAGIGGQSPEELHEFINKQNYMLLHDDNVRIRAQQILENNHQPPGFTADPDQYAQFVQTQNLNWDGNQLQLTLGWPNAVQGKAMADAVLRALTDEDQYLDQAKTQARRDADDARDKVDALNTTRARLNAEHKSLADKAADMPDPVSINDANQQVIQLSQELKDAVMQRTARETELAELKTQDPTKPIDPEQDKEIVDLKSRLQPLNEQIQIARRKEGAAASEARVAGAAVPADATTQPDAGADPLLAALQQQAELLTSQIQRRREELAVESAIPPEQRKVNQESAIENLSVKISSLSKTEKDLRDGLKAATDKANQNQAKVEAARIAEASKEDVYRQIQDTDVQLQTASSTSLARETAYANCITVADTPHNPVVQYVSTTDLRKSLLLGASVLTWVVMALLILGELRRPRLMTSVRPAAAPRVAPPPMRVIPWPQPQQPLGLEDHVEPQPQATTDTEHAVLF